MTVSIGIMQGRLTASATGVLQEFPRGNWQREFEVAKGLGFGSIEWLFDSDDPALNPLFSTTGREEIREVITSTGLPALSVCAHFFVEGQLVSVDGGTRSRAIETAVALVSNAEEIGAKTVVLPFGEGASVQSKEARGFAVDSLRRIAEAAETANVRLALELDVDAETSATIVEALSSPAAGICYDLGNATATGMNVTEELRELAPFLYEVHIKDRKIAGPNVSLGEGAVDFDSAFSLLSELSFQGPFTLETFKNETPETLGQTHLEFVRKSMERARIGVDR